MGENKYIQDCRTFPADAALAYRLEGIRGVWDALAERTVYRIVRTGRVLVFAQLLDSTPRISPPAGVVIRPPSDDDWPMLAGIVTQRNLARFRGLVLAGRHGLVAWRDRQPIGYAWVAQDMGPDVAAFPLSLPTYAAYLWNLYVVPCERSNGVGSALASARNRTALELGFREGWRMISPSNAPSLRTLVKTGTESRLIAQVRFIKVMGTVHSRFSPPRN